MPKRGRSSNGFASRRKMPKLETIVKAAAATARAVRTFTRTASGDRKSAEGPQSAITSQHDSKLLYRRKRAPKSVRRRARNRYKRHLSMQLQAVNDNTNLFTTTGTITSVAGGQQLGSITAGYLVNGVGLANDKVGSIFDFYQNIANASPEDQLFKIYMTGMSTDYTLVNTSENLAEVDVYEFIYRKNYNNDAASAASMKVFLEENMAEEEKLPGATASYLPQQVGWVPTDCNKMMTNVIIQSKQRYYMGAGNAISFTKRHKFFKPIYISNDDVNSHSSSATVVHCKAFFTRGIIIVAKGVPGTNAVADAVTIKYNAQSRYRAKMINQEPDKSALNF